VAAKVIKLIGLSPPLFLSPTNLVTFAGTQNGEKWKLEMRFSQENEGTK
jgi:hypothetical protein